MTFNSPLASPRATRDKLEEWGIVTKKSLGQHFLVDDGVVGRILRLADPTPDDLVLEIGPGIGTLTEALLLKGARVLALEKDVHLLPILEELKTRYPHAFDYRHIDALDFLAQASMPSPATKLIANLPYAVAATIVLDCLVHMPSIQSITVMVQKEVAERMMAAPGSKDYGAYSVKLQLLAKPLDSFQVSPSCFIPPPRVTSTVIRLDRCADQITQEELPGVFIIIEAAFAERRKTIRNSMRSYFARQGLDQTRIDPLLETCGIPFTIRGETLTPTDFSALGRRYLDPQSGVN